MEISYKTDDGSIQITLKYIVGRGFHNYPGIGKSWPKHTQCLCFVNGLMKGFGEVVKHEKDLDNQKLAYKLATKKAIEKMNLKYLRKELWLKLLNEIEKD